MNERCHAWNPISPALDGAEVTVEVIRVEATTRPAPPYGQSVLMLEIVARRAESGDLVGAWLLTFVYIMAYRMRPLNHPGNPELTSPSEHAMFWKLFPSQYLVECTAMDKMREWTKFHHYVIRTDLGDAFEVIAQQWECRALPYRHPERQLELRSDDNQLYMTLTFRSREAHLLPSVSLDVMVAAQGFQGMCEDVWFDEADAARFLSDLRQLEQSRAGSAVLHSMSPDELLLSFSAIDRAGHILITVSLKQGEYYIENRLLDNRLSAAFALDPTQLPGISAQLRELFEEHGETDYAP